MNFNGNSIATNINGVAWYPGGVETNIEQSYTGWKQIKDRFVMNPNATSAVCVEALYLKIECFSPYRLQCTGLINPDQCIDLDAPPLNLTASPILQNYFRNSVPFIKDKIDFLESAVHCKEMMLRSYDKIADYAVAGFISPNDGQLKPLMRTISKEARNTPRFKSPAPV